MFYSKNLLLLYIPSWMHPRELYWVKIIKCPILHTTGLHLYSTLEITKL